MHSLSAGSCHSNRWSQNTVGVPGCGCTRTGCSNPSGNLQCPCVLPVSWFSMNVTARLGHRPAAGGLPVAVREAPMLLPLEHRVQDALGDVERARQPAGVVDHLTMRCRCGSWLPGAGRSRNERVPVLADGGARPSPPSTSSRASPRSRGRNRGATRRTTSAWSHRTTRRCRAGRNPRVVDVGRGVEKSARAIPPPPKCGSSVRSGPRVPIRLPAKLVPQPVRACACAHRWFSTASPGDLIPCRFSSATHSRGSSSVPYLLFRSYRSPRHVPLRAHGIRRGGARWS